ncbi:hypothetical protein DPMN_069717 [Dreissena polymorpha]|uniref:Fibronectin type-III domain-containing protein n=1 Tax=Dreissena polymorpha TaxID=45954 RepID=A0A9D3Z426_DREPO|nr:hypothetical protein DPMN_069717 [Dreissena polymorpha]
MLNPIEPAPNKGIIGVYEQITGLLPVKGTTNVHGIIQYYVSWNVNGGAYTSEHLVPDFVKQTFCTSLNFNDGETYTFNIRSIDIVGNTYNESRTVFIDRSHPHINNVWLEKDGYKGLFVHNTTDLSKMQMTFEALDPHSGLKFIHWIFGTSDTSTELLRGNIAVGRMTNVSQSETNIPINLHAFVSLGFSK